MRGIFAKVLRPRFGRIGEGIGGIIGSPRFPFERPASCIRGGYFIWDRMEGVFIEGREGEKCMSRQVVAAVKLPHNFAAEPLVF